MTLTHQEPREIKMGKKEGGREGGRKDEREGGKERSQTHRRPFRQIPPVTKAISGEELLHQNFNPTRIERKP